MPTRDRSRSAEGPGRASGEETAERPCPASALIVLYECSVRRELEHETGAGSGALLDLDPSAVRGDHPPHDEQSQPGRARVFAVLEALVEDLSPQIARNARAFIGHAASHASVGGRYRHADRA